MSFCQWSSVLEYQQGLSFATCASAILDEFISKRSDNENSSLVEEYRSTNSTGGSSNITLLSVTDSSGSRSEMLEVSIVALTSVIDNLFGTVV